MVVVGVAVDHGRDDRCVDGDRHVDGVLVRLVHCTPPPPVVVVDIDDDTGRSGGCQ